MAGATIWKGTIRFGDVTVAVKLHSAVRQERIEFHLLHARDLVRLHQQMLCAAEQVPVASDAQVKGYEVEEGRYILVEEAELEQLVPESSRTIDIHEFVPSGEIDPLLFEHVYYLEADAALGAGGYNALLAALQELGMAGICTWVMRKRAYHGTVQACGKILRLSTLRYADEVLPVAALELESPQLSERELQIGSDLIRQMAAPFQPQKFVNEHRHKLQQLIEQKARGEKIVVLRPKLVVPTAAERLLETLEASLKQVA